MTPPEPVPRLTTDEVVWELQLSTPPIVVPPEPVPVGIWHDGSWWPGLCDGWRGGDLPVRFAVDDRTTRLLWLPARDVPRRA